MFHERSPVRARADAQLQHQPLHLLDGVSGTLLVPRSVQCGRSEHVLFGHDRYARLLGLQLRCLTDGWVLLWNAHGFRRQRLQWSHGDLHVGFGL